MPTIEIEASRLVHYAICKEVSPERAEYFRLIKDSPEDKQNLQEFLEDIIDVRYDVTDAEGFDMLNGEITED
jgi:hypothetical protein